MTNPIKARVEHIVTIATPASKYAENFDTKQNAYLDGVRAGAHTALTAFEPLTAPVDGVGERKGIEDAIVKHYGNDFSHEGISDFESGYSTALDEAVRVLEKYLNYENDMMSGGKDVINDQIRGYCKSQLGGTIRDILNLKK